MAMLFRVLPNASTLDRELLANQVLRSNVRLKHIEVRQPSSNLPATGAHLPMPLLPTRRLNLAPSGHRHP